jgi:hypothetical protein
LPLTPSRNSAIAFLHQVGLGEHPPGMGEHDLAFLGQPLETPAALDDHHAELLLELDDRG